MFRWKVFQLDQPIGGSLARELSKAWLEVRPWRMYASIIARCEAVSSAIITRGAVRLWISLADTCWSCPLTL